MRDSRELSFEYYSQDADKKKSAVYETLFERRSELLPELKKAATYESDERLAILMAQTCLIIENYPREASKEKRIADILNQGNGVSGLIPEQWNYLEHNAPSNMMISVLGVMDTIPVSSMNFIDVCLNSPDPNVRAMACKVGIKSGRPVHFAGVLRLITDRDAVVAKTAFETIKAIPETELGLHLECALMSSDEWLLTNVAPFLPYLATEKLRKMIMRMQLHKHPIVAENAKLAVYKLNEELNRKLLGNNREILSPEEKEYLEQERLKREAEEAFERDISNVTPDEIDIFAKEIDGYASGWSSLEENHLNNNSNNFAINNDKNFDLTNLEIPDNPSDNFIEQTNTLSQLQTDLSNEEELLLKEQNNIDSALLKETNQNEVPPSINQQTANQESVNIATAELAQTSKLESLTEIEPIQNTESETETTTEKSVIISTPKDATIVEPIQNSEQITLPEESSTKAEPEIIATIEQTQTFDSNLTTEQTQDSELKSDLQDKKTNQIAETVSNLESEPKPNFEPQILHTQHSDSETSQSAETTIITKPESIEYKFTAPVINDFELLQATTPLEKSVQNEMPPIESSASIPETFEPIDANAAYTDSIQQTENENAKTQNTTNKLSKISIPNDAKELIRIFPSFISIPFYNIFKAKNDQERLKYLSETLSSLIAFLNLCFIQSCLYYAEGTDSLAKNIKQCLKNRLVGPAALRNLHNFVMAMKPARGNPIFFTFTLAGIMSESSDTNPLMLMRELQEYLRNPIEPLEETLSQAVDGMAEILRGVRCIKNNTIVMRAPTGAKQPYANLSGVNAVPLEESKRPLLELPVGEVVLLSKDGTEALGLHPFIKYKNRKTERFTPGAAEMKLFYDRLEIPESEREL